MSWAGWIGPKLREEGEERWASNYFILIFFLFQNYFLSYIYTCILTHTVYMLHIYTILSYKNKQSIKQSNIYTYMHLDNLILQIHLFSLAKLLTFLGFKNLGCYNLQLEEIKISVE